MTEEHAASAGDDLVQLEAVVAEHRRMAAENPDTLYPGMADALMGMAGKLAEAGRFDEALAAALEGVEQFRAMAEADPGTFAIHLAASLNNLSNRLGEAGRPDDADKAGAESISLSRSLLPERPEQAGFVLVSALLNQAGRAWGAGNGDAALAHMADAARIFHESGEGLQPFLGVMIEALHRNAMALAEAGKWHEAVAVRRLSLDLFPETAPAPVRHLLALTLEQQAFASSRDGDRDAALPLVEEAVAIARGLDAEQPAEYRLFLGQALANFASRAHEAGANQPAFEAAIEAINVFKEVAHTDAQAAVMPLVMTLETFASILAALGHVDQARTVVAQRDELVKLIDDTEGGEG